MKTHPTLRSLAAEAGVSVTTVSFALRGSPEVSAATRDRLRQLARARGYRPNPLVAAVYSQVRTRKAQGDHAVIGYLNTWWPKRTWETCSTKTGQFHGAAERARELGFQLENFWLREPGMTPRRFSQILKARGIRGLLIGPLQNQTEPLSLPWQDFALATIGYSLHSPAVSLACHAHFRGMARAMDELIARGYRRIGYVTSRDFEERVNSLWGAAYRLKQHEHSTGRSIEPLVFEGDSECDSFRRWLRQSRPDAIVNSLPGVYELLGEVGLRAPQDLGFAHLDLPNHLRAQGVSGIDQLWDISGAAALDLIANQLLTHQRGLPRHPLIQLMEGAWIAGRTLRPLPVRSSP
ncbi:MAG TPA: LacI family DNA-binding transcriptional regulator [Opitutaceae bacterium]|jgi:LacI family transcriptional regulator